jgi:hypothetical protein
VTEPPRAYLCWHRATYRNGQRTRTVAVLRDTLSRDFSPFFVSPSVSAARGRRGFLGATSTCWISAASAQRTPRAEAWNLGQYAPEVDTRSDNASRVVGAPIAARARRSKTRPSWWRSRACRQADPSPCKNQNRIRLSTFGTGSREFRGVILRWLCCQFSFS